MKSKESLDQRSTHLSGVLNHKDLPNLIKCLTVVLDVGSSLPTLKYIVQQKKTLVTGANKTITTRNMQDQEIGGNSLSK